MYKLAMNILKNGNAPFSYLSNLSNELGVLGDLVV